MDPANADGMKFPGVAASDCSDLFVPQDLSTENMTISLGAMDKCGAGGEGWQGTGTSGDPYRFHLSGESNADRISVAYNTKFDTYKKTYSIWFKSNDSWDSDAGATDKACALLHQADSSDSVDGFNLHLTDNGYLHLQIKENDGSSNEIISTTNILNNKWHHITIQFNKNPRVILYDLPRWRYERHWD